ncbi:CLUMA_CG019766, isoform A [Clunio marinus]|uniref:CLUMA_CG019766, isoform A n=1 Tax=Clunio marinus TaxID=568069 RepID=A0A1J1J1P3_9DIPT|nr:CLUMA_CG019766, isoform A [Clunio marinus]
MARQVKHKHSYVYIQDKYIKPHKNILFWKPWAKKTKSAQYTQKVGSTKFPSLRLTGAGAVRQ